MWPDYAVDILITYRNLKSKCAVKRQVLNIWCFIKRVICIAIALPFTTLVPTLFSAYDINIQRLSLFLRCLHTWVLDQICILLLEEMIFNQKSEQFWTLRLFSHAIINAEWNLFALHYYRLLIGWREYRAELEIVSRWHRGITSEL